MDLKIKKIIAREIIILSCIITIILITYGGLKISNNKTDNNRQALTNEKLTFEAKLDSIIKLPWNLNWDKTKPQVGQVYNESNSPNPDLEYSKRNSNDSITIIDLTSKLELNKKETSNLSNFDTNSILRQLSIIILLIAYPLRGLILLLRWSVKTIKE
jgi:hypothetical protein